MNESRRRLGIFMLLLSGTAGFLLGSLVNGTWQLAVESSQVIAHIVEYNRENPFYLYHSKAWTLLHQVPAVLLYFGISERTVCFFLSGFIGSLSFVTVSLFVWVVCGRLIFALTCPFLMLFSSSTEHFVVYPVWMMGTSNSQGVIATFFIILVITLIAAGKRIGFLLLGIAPAIHLSLGFICWMIVSSVLIVDRRLKSQLRANWKYLVIGFAITLLSLVFHGLFTYDAAAHRSTADSSAYLYSFIKSWDSHRIPVAWYRTGFQINLAVLSISLFWLWKHPSLSDASRRLFMALAVTVVVGLIFAVLSWISPEMIPSVLIILMPARILEVNVVLFVPLVLGLIGNVKNKFAGLIMFLGLMMLLLIYKNFSSTLFFCAWICMLLVPAFRFFSSAELRTWIPRVEFYATCAILLLIMARVMLFPELYRPESNEYQKFKLSDTDQREFFGKVSMNRGLLLTAGDLHLIQLRTRRPLLLDGGQLDIVPYTLEAAPSIATILQEVYGIDFWNPPPESKRMATIQGNTNHDFWEKRSLAQWMDIGRRYGITNVMTFVTWRLNLPKVVQNKDFVLYQIPHEADIVLDAHKMQIPNKPAK